MSSVPAREPGLVDTVQALWSDLRGAFSDRVELFSFELSSAVRAATQILALIVAAAVVGVTAWLAAWGVVTGGLIALGLHWAVALLLVLVVNLGAVWWAVACARKLLPRLSLPATRRHLTLARSTAAPPAPTSPKPSAVAPSMSHPLAPGASPSAPRPGVAAAQGSGALPSTPHATRDERAPAPAPHHADA